MRVPCKHSKIILELSENQSIVILKQGKERVAVAMRKQKYRENGISLLTIKHFKQLSSDPTKTLKFKVQRSLRKMKSKTSPNEYGNLYTTCSCPGKFYGTVKLHKFHDNIKLMISQYDLLCHTPIQLHISWRK